MEYKKGDILKWMGSSDTGAVFKLLEDPKKGAYGEFTALAKCLLSEHRSESQPPYTVGEEIRVYLGPGRVWEVEEPFDWWVKEVREGMSAPSR